MMWLVSNVPKYPELSVEKLWELIQECDDLTDYFPDLEDSKLPERDFMIGILSTLRGDEMRQLIKTARSIVNTSDQSQLVEMSVDIKDYLFSILPQKTTSGRANFLLKSGAKLRRKKAVPKKYSADLSILARNQPERDQENKNDQA